MAEPLGIIGVIGVAGQIINAAVNLGLDWKDAPADAKHFMTEMQTLKTVLSETYTNIIVNPDFKDAFEGRNSTLLTQLGATGAPTDASVMVSLCKQELDAILIDLNKQAHGGRVGWERLKGAILSKRRRETVENLQRQCETLNRLLTVDSLTLAVATHKEVTQGRKEQQQWRKKQDNQEVLDWITKFDYSTQYSDFLRRRQSGTGQWLLESAEYQQWVDATEQTLFCPGIPGAGKTILASIVVEDLRARYPNDGSVGIAFLYCNFRRHAEQRVDHLLASLLKQLSQDWTSLPESVRNLYEKHKGRTRPSLEELSKALQTVAKLFSQVFIVVDALDECQLPDGSRSTFLTEIFALQTVSGANIFATSRFIQNITDRFEGSVVLEIRANRDDVRKYLEGNMSHMSSCVGRSPELQEEIVDKIIQAVDGMFLLAQLHLDSLKGKSTRKAVRLALANLHTGSQAYDHAYSDAMERIEGQLEDEEKLAKQVLSWITCAKRPLSTTELQHALGVEVGETELDLDNISPIEDIVSVCAGLVTVDEESSIVRLVHYTTQEYFARSWQKWFPDARKNIADICATYLSFSPFDKGHCHTDDEFEDRLRSHPHYDYTAHFWGEHAREYGKTSQLAQRFLESDMHVDAQVQALLTVKTSWRSTYSQQFPKRMNGLHVAAVFGLEDEINELLKINDDPDIMNSWGNTPLSLAARNGHEGVVRILLDTKQANIDSRDKYGQTPLSWAAEKGHEGVIKILLAQQADIDSRDSIYNQTPLSRAAENGHEGVVRILLDTKQANIDSRDKYGQTPLSWAAEKGHEGVVRILLDTKQANIDSRDKYGQTPLSWAAEKGREGVVRMLLAHQVVVGSMDSCCQILLWAATKGHEAVVRILLETTNINTETEDTAGLTALQLSVFHRHESVEKLLLAHGAVVPPDFYGLQSLFPEM